MPKSTKTTPSTTTKPRTRKSPTTPTPTVSTPNHDEIANRAYELFLSNGAMHGRDLEHWLQAESELRDRSITAGH